jgi:hypothetical protein
MAYGMEFHGTQGVLGALRGLRHANFKKPLSNAIANGLRSKHLSENPLEQGRVAKAIIDQTHGWVRREH